MAQSRIGSRLSESSVFLKLSLFLIGICTVIQIIGLATDYWIFITTPSGFGAVHHGLWKVCSKHYGLGIGYCIDYGSESQPHWHRAVQAMEIIGVLGLGATLIGLIIGVCITGKKGFRILTIVNACGSAMCIFIGVITFGASTPSPEYLHYSFGLCVTAGILTLIAVVLMFVDLSRKTPPAPQGPAVSYNANGNVILYAGPPGYMVPGQTPYVPSGQPPFIAPGQSPYNAPGQPPYNAPAFPQYSASGPPPYSTLGQTSQTTQNTPGFGQAYAEQPPPKYTDSITQKP